MPPIKQNILILSILGYLGLFAQDLIYFYEKKWNQPYLLGRNGEKAKKLSSHIIGQFQRLSTEAP